MKNEDPNFARKLKKLKERELGKKKQFCKEKRVLVLTYNIGEGADLKFG